MTTKYDPSRTESLKSEMKEHLELVLSNCHPNRLFRRARFYEDGDQTVPFFPIMNSDFIREISPQDLEKYQNKFRFIKQMELRPCTERGETYRGAALRLATWIAAGTRNCTLVNVSEEPSSERSNVYAARFYADPELPVPIEMYYTVACH